jgi:hypothetical protein
VEISYIWQRQEVCSSNTYEQSLILVRVQKTGHIYTSQRKSQVKNSSFCPRMRTMQRQLWRSWVVQTSQWEMEWHVSSGTGGNLGCWASDVRGCVPSPLTTSHQPFGQFGSDLCTLHNLNYVSVSFNLQNQSSVVCAVFEEQNIKVNQHKMNWTCHSVNSDA